MTTMPSYFIIIIFFFFFSLCCCSISSSALTPEQTTLLAVKASILDTSGSLSTWSDRDATPCNWTGVTCSQMGSVVSVDLSGMSLEGPFPVSLCRLTALSNLSLSNNEFNSSLPDSVTTCRNLVHLDLSLNFLWGTLPAVLSDLRFLRYLNLANNHFSGEIPVSFGSFHQLEVLLLNGNLLNRSIPSSLGNITSLKDLSLAYNPFSKAQIPPQFGNLSNLEVLWLTNCSLTSSIPDSLSHLSKLLNLDVAYNGLTGPIPSMIFQLKSVVQIELYGNNFTGNLSPTGWSNLTQLRRFDASMNQLVGVIPDELCQLPLESLNLFQNRLTGSIPESIAKSPNLIELKLAYNNQMMGSLPAELGKYSRFTLIDVAKCNLSGEIPEFLCQNGALEQLLLLNNTFTGKLPFQLGECKSLKRVRLMGNRFYGEIPPKFWGLPHLNLLELSGNAFSGNISHLISGAKSLSELYLSENRFSGTVPSEIGSATNLVLFAANQNELSGEIPTTVGKLINLNVLDLSQNKISGSIPKTVQYLKRLSKLNFADNGLSGKIPNEIGNLHVLSILDLSQNKLSGNIPMSLQSLPLTVLNLSSNHLSGDIPPQFVQPAYRDSFRGNPGLCSEGTCNSRIRKSKKTDVWNLALIVIASFLGGCFFLYSPTWFTWHYDGNESLTTNLEWAVYHKLSFDELEITDNSLTEDNVIGTGASGKVYKVVLSNSDTVAVKKFLERLQEHQNSTDSVKDEFKVEVDMLGKIRHKNIVKLWCSSKSNSKLLVYEFMANGSLGDLLHSANSQMLDWPKRLRIALDAAEGLSYLHHGCDHPIIHRDVKPNNILVDENFRAKISDFGVSKVLNSSDNRVESMSRIAGSCGYIAPEYAHTTRVTEKSDVYSFGIVLLELVTGKTPMDPELGAEDLPNWVRKTVDQKGVDNVIDPNLEPRFREHIEGVLSIGLMCASTDTNERPLMRRVAQMLQEEVEAIIKFKGVPVTDERQALEQEIELQPSHPSSSTMVSS